LRVSRPNGFRLSVRTRLGLRLRDIENPFEVGGRRDSVVIGIISAGIGVIRQYQREAQSEFT
jgi:hypothetical protein